MKGKGNKLKHNLAPLSTPVCHYCGVDINFKTSEFYSLLAEGNNGVAPIIYACAKVKNETTGEIFKIFPWENGRCKELRINIAAGNSQVQAIEQTKVETETSL